jgi:hypothetical protein
MAIVPSHDTVTIPTNLALLPALLVSTQSLERVLTRPKRGVATLVLALVWLVLAWRGSGRPYHLASLDEPLLAVLLGQEQLPSPKTLSRSLAYFPAAAVRAAVEAAYQAELPRRRDRIWAAIDAHQIPYWGRGKLDRFEKGWSGSHSRRLRGYRLYVAVDTDTGQVITFLLVRGRRRDARVIGLLALLSEVLDAVEVPVLASGGIGTGRAMAASLAAGADGVRVGTRFVASVEAEAHPEYVQALIDARMLQFHRYTLEMDQTWVRAKGRLPA